VKCRERPRQQLTPMSRSWKIAGLIAADVGLWLDFGLIGRAEEHRTKGQAFACSTDVRLQSLPRCPEREDRDLRWHPQAQGESERAQPPIHRQAGGLSRAWRGLTAPSLGASRQAVQARHIRGDDQPQEGPHRGTDDGSRHALPGGRGQHMKPAPSRRNLARRAIVQESRSSRGVQ
jgi:hypothetical protein